MLSTLEYKRPKEREATINSKTFKYFTQEYYNKVSKHPGATDLIKLSKILKKDKKKVRAWFNYQRYKDNEV
jgi:hypothetical protein